MGDATKGALLEAMYEERLQALQMKMYENSIRYLFIPVSVNLRYVTGLALNKTERLTAAIVPQDGDPMIVCPSFEQAKFQRQINLKSAEFVPWDEQVDPYEAINAWFDGQGVRSRITIGLEPQAWYSEYERLAKAMPNATYVDASKVFEALRIIKSAAEVKHIKAAIGVIDDVRELLFKEFFKEGVRQRGGRAGLVGRLLWEEYLLRPRRGQRYRYPRGNGHYGRLWC